MLNFNTQPYYDDFNEDKNFHRILFKPGVAVQARELTQAQSILQDQIGKFGKFVLSDGSNVSGGKYTLDTNAKSLNLQNTGTIATDIPYFTGMYVVGESSRCVSLIASADILNYYIITKSIINGVNNYISGETLYIFSTKDLAYAYLNDATILLSVDYKSAVLNTDSSIVINNCSGQIHSTQFTIPSSAIEVGDIITAAIDNYSIEYIVTEVGYNSTISVNKQLQNDYNNVPLTITKTASRVVMEVNVDSGVYFTNNTFVKSLPQTIVPNSKTQFPSCIIGFNVEESIIDYIDDTSLLDPSQGSYNYTAPGADRYKIYLNLVSKPLVNGTFDQTTLTSTKFIELIRIKNGIVVSDNTDPVLGGLEDILAKQMYDHAGNFIVSPFSVSFNSSNFSDDEKKLNCSISSGKAYVFGYPFNASFPTNITLDKARKTDSSSTLITNTYYGNKIRIKDLTGSMPIPTNGSKVGLYSVEKGSSISENTLLGYANVRNIDYASDNDYSLFLYNVSIPQQKMLDVKCVAAVGQYGFSANTILNSNSQNVVTDPSFDKLLFKLQYPNVSSIDSIRCTLDLFTTIQATSNSATISSGSISNQFPTGLSSALSDEDKKQNFIIVTKSENGAYLAGQIVDLSDVKIEIKQVTNNNQAVITFNKGYTGQIDVKYSLVYTNAQKKTKTLHKDQVVKLTAKTLPTGIGYSDIAEFKGVFKTANPSVQYEGEWNNTTTYGNNSVVKYSNKLFSSSNPTNLGNIPDPTGPNWNLLQEVTNQYKLNNGQTESMYDFGTVTAKYPSSTGTVFVLFDYYTHSTDGEYIAYDSYPVSYKNVPTVTINNTQYSLKDYIDFRPRRKNSDNLDTVTYDSYRIPSSTTDTNLIYSMSYYLGRIDKLVLTKDKKLKWLNGESSYKNYIPPKDLPDAMTIATVQFDPYTPDLQSIKIKYAKHRRYTMDDIGDLDTRLQNVEYYTALNLAEKATLNTNIVDSYGTRLKNGFIVDAFTHLNVVDLSENNKNISIDLENNLARPSFTTKNYNVGSSFDVGETSLIKRNNLISFNYKEVPIIIQNQATGSTKINQFDCISYEGDLYLDPQSDVWTEQIGATIVNVSEDTAALMNSSEVPGLLYNDWNTIFSTKQYIQDSKDQNTTVNYNNVNYQVSSTQEVTKSTQIQLLAENVKPKSRSISIKFKAHGLAPLSRMFLYVNGHMVNAYVTPDENPMGIITSVKVTDPGSGYTSGSVTASITTSAPTPASLKLTVAGGVIDTVSLLGHGSGYPLGEQINVSITGSHTNTAIISASTVPIQATNLYSNKAGECSGMLVLPNSLISFDVGELILSVCDTPHYDLQNAIAVSHASFYTKTSYYKTVIDSIREPYITKSATKPNAALPNQDARIIVPASTDYLVRSYAQSYTEIKTGSITIPVYLNIEPTADVTVSFLLNASEDISSGVSQFTSNKTTLTFTKNNYNQIQNITLSYDLGDQPLVTSGTYGDNKLPTHIEFYSTSSDTRYDYGGTAIPLRSWLSSTPIKGTASTHLVPYTKFDPKAGPAAEQSPYIKLSPVLTSNVGGESFFTVSYGGGHEIGWWTESTTTYPLTFTATIANTDCAIISHSTYEDYENSDYIDKNVRTINKSDQQLLQFKYWLHGLAQGTTSVTVTAQSTNPNWNLTSESIPVVVGPSLLYPAPAIVVHPHAEIKGTSGVVLNAPRITSSVGTTQIVGISLSKRPTNNVSIAITSSKTAGGGSIYQVSEDGLVSVEGSTLHYTPNTWNQMKTVTVKGTTDPVLYHQATVDYNVTFTATSSDSDFNNLSSIVAMQNNDAGTTAPAPPPPPNPSYNALYQTLRGSSINEDNIAVEYTAEVTEFTGLLYWKISNGTTSNDDFVTTTGQFWVAGGKGTFNITAIADLTTENTESFTVQVYDNSSYSGSPKLSLAQTINDTSKTAVDTTPTYQVWATGTSMGEGEYLEFDVRTTNVTPGTTLYWTIDFKNNSTSPADFSNTSGQFTVQSDGTGVFKVYVAADNLSELMFEKFGVFIGTRPGENKAASTDVTITDTSKTAEPVVVPTYTYPEVVVSYNGTNHTRNNPDGVQNVVFNITLSGAPKAGDTITVTMSSDNTTTGGTISGSNSVQFTLANWQQQHQITMSGISLIGTDSIGVSYNANWSASATLSSSWAKSGKIGLINDKYKYTTSVFAYTDVSQEYTATINGNAGFTPSVTNLGSHFAVNEGTLDAGSSVTIVERNSTYIVLKVTATLHCIHYGTNNDSPGYKPAVLTVYGAFNPAAGTICDSAITVSVISAKSTASTLNWGAKGTIDPAVSTAVVGSLSGLEKPFYSWDPVKAKWGITISENTKKKAGEGAPGQIGPAMPIEVLVKLNGFYFDVDSASISVREDTYSSTTSLTYRTDNYETIGNPNMVSNSSYQNVPYNKNALTMQAVRKALTNYPTAPSYKFTGDEGADAITAAYKIGIYKTIIANLTDFINKIKAKNLPAGSPGLTTLALETTNLNNYILRLNSFTNIQ